MFEGKINTDIKFPVTLYDSSYVPVTGIAYGSIQVRYAAPSDSALQTYVVSVSDWTELGLGHYRLNIGASEFTSAGTWQVKVSGASFVDFNFIVNVQDLVDMEQITLMKSISADTINNLSTKITSVSADTWNYTIDGNSALNILEDLFAMASGEIVVSGANDIFVYMKRDNTTAAFTLSGDITGRKRTAN